MNRNLRRVVIRGFEPFDADLTDIKRAGGVYDAKSKRWIVSPEGAEAIHRWHAEREERRRPGRKRNFAERLINWEEDFALGNDVFTFRPPQDISSLQAFFERFRTGIIAKVRDYSTNRHPVKVDFDIEVEYSSQRTNDLLSLWYPNGYVVRLENANESKRVVDSAIDAILEWHDARLTGPSELVYRAVLRFRLTFQIIHVSGNGDIPTPEWLKNKKATINPILNKKQAEKYKNRCFETAVVTALYCSKVKSNQNHFSKYEQFFNDNDFPDFSMIGESVCPLDKSITEFEEKNKISVIIFSDSNYYKERANILRSVKNKYPRIAYLYLLSQKNGDGIDYHYIAVSNINRLLNTDATGSESHYRKHCPYCFWHYKTDEDAQNCKFCASSNGQFFEMPEEGECVKSPDVSKLLKHPVIIIADLENFVGKPKTDKDSAYESLAESTNRGHHGEGNSIAFTTIVNGIGSYWSYRGKDRMAKFWKALDKVWKSYSKYLENPVKIKMTEKEIADFESSTRCWICKNQIFDENDKVRDHCHITGNYRGAAHNHCNLNLKLPTKIPVFFHNLSGYDGHFLINESLDIDIKPSSESIAESSEKFISIQFKDKPFIFKDSLRIMPFSLDRLVQSLPLEMMKITREKLPDVPVEFLKRKGVMPYSKISDESYFNRKDFPPQDDFFNDLTKTEISEEDYNFGKKVWNYLSQLHGEKMNFGIYNDFYLKLDVLQLADVFEETRNFLIRNFRLDPAHYYSIAGLAWDAALLESKQKIELFSDRNMWEDTKKNIRGGMCGPALRYAKAEYQKIKSSIMSLDANSNYGWAMMNHLPTGNYRYLDEQEIKKFDILKVPFNSKKGYQLKVDISFPKEIHDKLNDLPVCPEHIKISEEMRSEYSKNLCDRGRKGEYLVGHFYDHLDYVIDYRMLQFVLKLGAKLKKVSSILEYSQKPYFKGYVNKCYKLRLEAVKSGNKFYEELTKLMMNSVFGKTIQDASKYKKVYFCGKASKFEKYAIRPGSTPAVNLREDFVAIMVPKENVRLDSPIIVGFTILELAKLLIFDMWYNVLVPRYQENNLRLLYHDTDSLLYYVETENAFDDIRRDDLKEHFDLSNIGGDDKNLKRPGKFKIVYGEKVITEAVALQSKHVAVGFEDTEDKKASGIPRKPLENQISIDDYRKALELGKAGNVSFARIVSKNHQVETSEENRMNALSANDEKRYVFADGTDSLAYGHYRI